MSNATPVPRSVSPRCLPPLGVLLFVLLTPASAVAETPLSEEKTITALDVLVEVGAPAGSRSPAPDLPRNLQAEDFDVRLDGFAVVPVGFSDPRSRRDETEPWSTVIYFDLRLAERDSIRWAASELAERVDTLVELGSVEIVVGDESPRRLLGPTRDAQLIENQLAGLALDPRGVHEVIEARVANLSELPETSSGSVSSAWVRAVVEAEAAAVTRRLDQMLLWVVERGPSEPKRALIWVTDGFDLDPASFYRERGLSFPGWQEVFTSTALSFARTLAGYGWVTFSFAPRAPGPGLVPGKRFGKWLYRPRMPAGLIGGTLTREERRDPDKAESYLEIGEAELGQADAESAREAFEKALYHFAGDPRSGVRQAAAKAGLGRSLEALGRPAEARQMYRHAVALDPELAPLYPQAAFDLLDPIRPLETVTLVTAGRTVRDAEAIDEAVQSLGRRARLTYQVEGRPEGRLAKLDVFIAGSPNRLRHPGWVRSGALETVAAARARSILRGEAVDGALDVRANLDRGRERKLEARVSQGKPGAPDDEPRTMRVSLAIGTPGGAIRVQHERIDLPSGAALSDWVYRTTLDALDRDEWVAVVIEDVESGEWGAELVE